MTDAVAQSPSGRRHGRAVLGACGGAHFMHDGLSDGLYVLLPLWAEAFGLSLAEIGVLKTVYSGAMASFQLPAGFLAERFGERRLLVAGTVGAGIAYLLMALVAQPASFPVLVRSSCAR